MLEGVNDSPAQARALARLLKGHPAKVNLIPFNPFPGTRYTRSPAPAIQRFRDELLQRGVLATVRRTRGEDHGAARKQGHRRGRASMRTTANSTAYPRTAPAALSALAAVLLAACVSKSS